MIINTMKWFFGLLLVGLLCSCSTSMDPVDKLAELSRKDFTSALRWKQYPVAAGFMQADLRQDFINTFVPLKDNIHITDVRIVDLQSFEEGRRFETTMEMDYYLLPSLLVKTFTFKQIWVYNDDENAAQQGFTVATPFPEFP